MRQSKINFDPGMLIIHTLKNMGLETIEVVEDNQQEKLLQELLLVR